MLVLVVVIAIAVSLWYAGFNIYVEGLLSAYIGTWIDSPIAGIVLTIGVIVTYQILKFIRSIF